MHPKIDEYGFRELLTESDDLQSDAMRSARTDLNAYVDAAEQSRYDARRSLGIGGALPGAGAAALALVGPAFATSAKDVMALQTAAGIENLAVLTYQRALTLSFIGGSSANGVIKAFAVRTMAQHEDHAKGFNVAARKLGGKAQTAADPKYTRTVRAAADMIKDAGDVVSLAITLEDVAAQSYTKSVGQVSTGDLRRLFGGVAGVEAQHKAILLALQALLKAGVTDLIAPAPNAAKLPAAVGAIGFPDTFFPTVLAAPVAAGAVR